MSFDMEAAYMPSQKFQLYESIDNKFVNLLTSWCSTFSQKIITNTFSSQNETFNINNGGFQLPSIFLNERFELRSLLSNSTWLENDIQLMAKKLEIYKNSKLIDSELGQAFYLKYGFLPKTDDSRSATANWNSNLERVLSFVEIKAKKGDLLHIGSDDFWEHQVLHRRTKSVTLADISRGLLEKALVTSPYAKSINTKAEELFEISTSSVDFWVALRVLCARNLDVKAAIKQAKRVLRPGGSILLSLSNGYHAIDNTVLPGQIVESPPRLDFSLPFQKSLEIIKIMYNLGFREVFFMPSATELFIGGKYLPDFIAEQNSIQELHIENFDAIPICFYSELMPNSWLGNYSPHPFQLDGREWQTVEHYFQAAKFYDPGICEKIRTCPSPGEAKSLAWSLNSMVRDDWAISKVHIMHKALVAKFDQHPLLRRSLALTGNRELVEQSSTDFFWGKSLTGQGDNMMGKLLMELRTKY